MNPGTTYKERNGTFFPLRGPLLKSKPVIRTQAAKDLLTSGIRLVYHGDRFARNIFAFGPGNKQLAVAYSQQISPSSTRIYYLGGENSLAQTLRAELIEQNQADGLLML
jgi:hypothetical protein